MEGAYQGVARGMGVALPLAWMEGEEGAYAEGEGEEPLTDEGDRGAWSVA